MNKAFQKGFIKRAQEYGLNLNEANYLLKSSSWLDDFQHWGHTHPDMAKATVRGAAIGGTVGVVHAIAQWKKMKDKKKEEENTKKGSFYMEHPEAVSSVVGGLGGAGVGALASGKGKRIEGALTGGVLGGTGGYLYGNHVSNDIVKSTNDALNQYSVSPEANKEMFNYMKEHAQEMHRRAESDPAMRRFLTAATEGQYKNRENIFQQLPEPYSRDLYRTFIEGAKEHNVFKRDREYNELSKHLNNYETNPWLKLLK